MNEIIPDAVGEIIDDILSSVNDKVYQNNIEQEQVLRKYKCLNAHCA